MRQRKHPRRRSEHRSLDPIPGASDSVGLGWGKLEEFAILTRSQVTPTLPACGPDLGNAPALELAFREPGMNETVSPAALTVRTSPFLRATS